MPIFSVILDRAKSFYSYVSEVSHRRALAMVIVFIAARLTTKLAGLDVDTVDALLVLLLPPAAAWSQRSAQDGQ